MVVRFPVLLVSLLALVLGLAGCGGPPTTPVEQLPAASELLAKSAQAMGAVRTVALDAQVDPALTSLPLRSATGKLTAAGEAVGSAALKQGDSAVEFQFVVTKGSLYLKGPTGSYQRLPLALAAGIYDPTTLLSPDVGVAALLRTATGGVTEAGEDVDGVPAYRVRAALDQQLVGSVLPGTSGATSGLVWLDKETSRLLKARIDVPTGAEPNGPTAPVTVTLSEFDEPVTVTAPTP